MNTVIIPCYQRPEMLYYCLEQIKKAEGAEENFYLFQIDVGFDRALIPIIDLFPFVKEKRFTNRTPYKLTKQSYSLLNAYLYAAEISSNLVYLIEEDIMIASDFFRYHEAVQKKNDVFASLSTTNNNRSIEDAGGENEYYFSSGDYCSLGVCMKKEIIKNFITPHYNTVYFYKPIEYIRAKFPPSAIGDSFAEQDGLIRRIQMEWGLPTVYPYVPRAFHAGFYGKNRGKIKNMDAKNKIKYVGEIIFSDQKMKDNAIRPEYYMDSKPINLDIPKQKNYQLKQLSDAITAQ